MGVFVTGNTSTASVALSKPRASIVVVSPISKVSVAIPAASVAYVEILVAASLDTTGRYKFVADAAAVVDTTQITFERPLADSSGTQSFVRLALAKGLDDAAFTLDELSYAVSKQLADAYNVPDHLAHELAKRVFDAAGVTEDSVYALHKLLNDGVAMNDLFDVGDGSVYSFVKAVTNVVFANEQLARDVSKKLEDSAAMLSAPVLHVEKAPFVDASLVADTTDVVPQLGKSDSVGAPDTQALNVTKLTNDLFAVAEFIQSVVEKSLSDAVSPPDDTTLAVDKPLSDSAAPLSAKAYDLSKLLGDSVGVTESIEVVIVIIREFSDAVAASEAKALAFAKASQDSVELAESHARSVSKALTDGVGMSDFTGIGDGLAFVLVRTVANFAFITDNSARQSLLTKSELTNVTDSGSLVNQDYCDLTYFAEDYVGVARSF